MSRTWTILLTIVGLLGLQLSYMWWPELADQGVSTTLAWLVGLGLVLATWWLDRYDRHDQK